MDGTEEMLNKTEYLFVDRVLWPMSEQTILY